MNNTICACGRPAHNGDVCPTCVDDLHRALGECPWVTEELEVTITRQRGAATESGPRSTNTSLPWHEKASDLRRELHATLTKWMLYCSRHQVTGTPRWHGADNIPARSRWLLNAADGLAATDQGPAAVEEVTSAVAACIRIIDLRPERRWAGPCGCGVDLYATTGQQWVRCDVCGEQTDTDELLSKLKAAVWGRLVTAAEGAGLLSKFGYPTQQGTIDKWRDRHNLQERGHNHKGHRLYLWDDLEERARKNAERRAG